MYALAAEPLAISIQANPEIQGLCSGHLIENISMYVDGTLLYLAILHYTTTLWTIEQFGSFTSFKVNWEKSQILPNSFPPTRMQAHLPLQRVNTIK